MIPEFKVGFYYTSLGQLHLELQLYGFEDDENRILATDDVSKRLWYKRNEFEGEIYDDKAKFMIRKATEEIMRDMVSRGNLFLTPDGWVFTN